MSSIVRIMWLPKKKAPLMAAPCEGHLVGCLENVLAFWGLSPRSLDVAGADARMRVEELYRPLPAGASGFSRPEIGQLSCEIEAPG
jgi:hypothetical protein